MKHKLNKLPAWVALGGAMLGLSAHAQVPLFSDNFTTDTSSGWIIRAGSGTGVDDYTAEFGFNYATNRFTRNGVTNTIPLAPNSTVGVATNGVKVTVNKNDAVADTAAVCLYPNISQVFSNDYTLKFDMWINYNGGEGGGTGSTEFGMFGINESSAAASWTFGTNAGVWFAVTGEGGAARDYRAYVGDNLGNADLELTLNSGGFLDRDGDLTVEQEIFTEPETAPLKLLFPKPTSETAGLPSKQWVQVEIRQRTNDLGGNVVTWLINGYVIAQHSQGDAFTWTNGNVMIGAQDPFSSIASPKEDNFVIFDNVRVLDLSGVATNELLTIVATDSVGTEPSGDDGVVTIARTGSTALPVDVSFRVAGNATRGSDYVTQTNGVTFTGNTVRIPAGQQSIDVAIKVLNDGIGESVEQVYVVLVGNPASTYDVATETIAKVDINDDGDLPTVTVSAFRRAAYEGNTNSYGQFRIELSNPITSGDLNISFGISGTAVDGTHYQTVGTTATVLSGSTNGFVTVLPIDNSDTVSNRTVILTLVPGAGYILGTTNTNSTVTIFNDDLAPALATLFSDNFDTDSSAAWTVSLGTSPVRDRATFAYDYSADGIPSAPGSGGTTKALKLEANVSSLSSALFSGLSAAPTGQSFTGDYRIRFKWWANYTGPLSTGGSGSTQLGTWGVGSGVRAHWPGGAVNPRDTVYFAMSGDGGTNPDIRAYTNGGAVLPTSFLTAGAGDNGNVYYAVFGNLAAPDAQLSAPLYGSALTGRTSLGAPGFVWHDVVVTKLGSTLLWHMDGLSMAAVNASRLGYTLSTNVFLGHSDINAGQSTLPEAMFSLYDNLVVESLAAPSVSITNIVRSGSSVVLTFTGGTNDPALAYVLQQATSITDTFTNNVTATITNVTPGVFRAVTTNSAASQYYRILR